MPGKIGLLFPAAGAGGGEQTGVALAFEEFALSHPAFTAETT